MYKGIQAYGQVSQSNSTEMVDRVKSDQTGKQVGSKQLNQIMTRKNLPWFNNWSVVVVDNDYSTKTFLSQQSQHSNLVVVTRAKSNRVFYQSPEPKKVTSKGHPKWYGDKFALKDETTWHQASEVVETKFTTKKGRLLKVKIRSWSDMLMRCSRDCPMHSMPFTLMQIQVSDREGRKVWKPMWLIMIGQRRHELTAIEGYQADRQ
ncbi:MAG: transposase [Cyanobacteria bacterium P01_C01_bin.72]